MRFTDEIKKQIELSIANKTEISIKMNADTTARIIPTKVTEDYILTEDRLDKLSKSTYYDMSSILLITFYRAV